MANKRTIPIPEGKYLGEIEVNTDTVDIKFKKKQKVALLFICLNQHYWPYLIQVVKDCKEKFLPHHNVDIFVWTDMKEHVVLNKAISDEFERIVKESQGLALDTKLKNITDLIIPLVTRFSVSPSVAATLSRLEKQKVFYRRDAEKMWLEVQHQVSPATYDLLCGEVRILIRNLKEEVEKTLEVVNVVETAPMEWPIPTLMRYHLFLNEEEKLKEYDSIFYLDSDMRVVEKISDEILSEGLTAAPHPGYAVNSKLIPPYEPNRESEAFIPRLGEIKEDEHGKKRFIPFYAAGGFQGGNAKKFLHAMKQIKKAIDKDFNKNYTAIWNDESHWNKYLFDYQRRGGLIKFLDVSYVYPDSLIKEYYTPLWGREFAPKIITLTKPFSLNKEGGEFLKKEVLKL